MNTVTKPFETYFGGKNGSGTYQTIINQIPPHRTYIEPFVGGGAIWRNKRPADISLLNDVDLAVVDRWVAAQMPECNDMKRVKLGSQIFAQDALLWLRQNQEWLDRSDSFLYVDPPYPHASRLQDTRYGCEMTDDDHRTLLAILNDYKWANIAISTYANDIYSVVLERAGWRRVEFESSTRGGTATEWLYMNYDEPEELHDYRYVGDDYRERERIAKKVRRHVAKFNKLPDLERKAILSALN